MVVKMIELNKIYCMDCLEGMKKLEDNSVNLVIADPPYNVNLAYKEYSDNLNEDYYKEWCLKWFSELKRICKDIILITPGYNNLHIWLNIEKPKGIIIWNKPNANSFNKIMGINVWEPILYYLCSDKIKHKVHIDLIKCNISLQKEIGNHPCPKPLLLFRRLINDYSNEGDVVLDPFIGSGTTAVGCKQLNRKYIGFEICEGYCKIADKRLSQANLNDWEKGTL